MNPVAGRGRTRRTRAALDAALATRGIPVCRPASAAAADEEAAARFAAGEGVIVCGGDGTVARIAGVAAEAGGTIAVVPTGAGNDFARHLGIDGRRPLDALELLTSGRVAACDLGRVTTADGTTAWFTTVANTGFDADANRWANGVRWARGTMLYVLAMLRTLATYRPAAVQVVVDGVEHASRAWLVAVANTRYYAGGMMIAPGAEVDDGLLDVCLVGPVSARRVPGPVPERVPGHAHPGRGGADLARRDRRAARRRRSGTRVLGERGARRPAPGDPHRVAGRVARPRPGRRAGYWAMTVACIPAARCPGTVQ